MLKFSIAVQKVPELTSSLVLIGMGVVGVGALLLHGHTKGSDAPTSL